MVAPKGRFSIDKNLEKMDRRRLGRV